MVQASFASHAHSVTCSYIFEEFMQECFVVCVGCGKHSLFASREIASQVTFAYKILRTKRFYAEARERQLIQLFKAVERKQKRLDTSHPGTCTTTLIVLVSNRHWWIGSTAKLTIHIKKKSHYHQLELVSSFLDDLELARMAGKFDDISQICISSPDLHTALNDVQYSAALNDSPDAQAVIERALARRKSGDYALLQLNADQILEKAPIMYQI